MPVNQYIPRTTFQHRITPRVNLMLRNMPRARVQSPARLHLIYVITHTVELNDLLLLLLTSSRDLLR
jgi:hypothetical protein